MLPALVEFQPHHFAQIFFLQKVFSKSFFSDEAIYFCLPRRRAQILSKRQPLPQSFAKARREIFINFINLIFYLKK